MVCLTFESITRVCLMRFRTLLECDMHLAIGVPRSTPKKLDDAVSEAIRFIVPTQAVKRSRPIGVHAIQHPNNHGNHG